MPKLLLPSGLTSTQASAASSSKGGGGGGSKKSKGSSSSGKKKRAAAQSEQAEVMRGVLWALMRLQLQGVRVQSENVDAVLKFRGFCVFAVCHMSHSPDSGRFSID